MWTFINLVTYSHWSLDLTENVYVLSEIYGIYDSDLNKYENYRAMCSDFKLHPMFSTSRLSRHLQKNVCLFIFSHGYIFSLSSRRCGLVSGQRRSTHLVVEAGTWILVELGKWWQVKENWSLILCPLGRVSQGKFVRRNKNCYPFKLSLHREDINHV